MNRILAQCQKEFRQFRRDKLTLALAFILPIITLFIFGFAVRLEAKNIPIFIQDLDQSFLSRSYIDNIYATNQFKKISYFPSFFQSNTSENNKPEKIIDQGIAKVAIIIPPDFSRKIKLNSPNNIQVIIDGSDVNNARIISNSIQIITTDFLNRINIKLPSNNIITKARLWFNPGRKESLYILPGVYGIVLWLYPSLLAALSVAREKEKGTIIQIYSSGISATEFLLGKLLTYITIGIGQACLVMIIGRLIWKLNLIIEPSSLIIGTILFLISSVSLGLMIGVKSNNQIGAIQGISPIVFLTTFVFSGFLYPIDNLPFVLSIIPYFVPPHYYILITRDAFVRGAGWSNIWLPMLLLTILGFLIFNMAKNGLKEMRLPD